MSKRKPSENWILIGQAEALTGKSRWWLRRQASIGNVRRRIIGNWAHYWKPDLTVRKGLAKGLVTVREAADLTGLSKMTIYRRIREDAITSAVIHGRQYVRRDELPARKNYSAPRGKAKR